MRFIRGQPKPGGCFHNCYRVDYCWEAVTVQRRTDERERFIIYSESRSLVTSRSDKCGKKMDLQKQS